MEVNYEGDGYQLVWPYKLKAVRSFRIERKFNAHAKCTFTAEMTEEEAEACIGRSSFEDSLFMRRPAEPKAESWFAGGITHVDIEMEDGIPHVKVEAMSRTYAMDLEPKNRSYQNKHLTYTDAILQLVKNYPRGDAQNMATSDQATIGSLMVQFEETDWQFLKRLASRVGTVILPDVVMDTPRVYFGVPDLSWGKELKAKRYTVLKNRAAYEELKAHAEGSDADLIHEADFVSYRITSEQFCQVGDDVVFKKQMWVVAESIISYASGLLTYEYVLVRRQTLRRKSRQNEGIQGVSLEGRVVKRANNMVKVHLDIDNAHDEQGNWWFPYSGEGNNMFHVLPDEGARIKVYFPNGVEKKAMAINSVRGGSEEMKSRTVFQKPTTKVFESPGAAKMQLGDDGVLFEKGTVSLHLDGGNITVNASGDVLLVAGNKVELGSGSDKGILESIRMRATNQVALQTNADHYVLISDNRVGIKSGKLDFQKVEVPFTELLTDEELEQMYLDEQFSEQLAANMEQEHQKDPRLSLEIVLQKVHPATKEQMKNDPNLGAKAKDWIKTQSTEKQQEFYQKRYGPKSSEPSKNKEAELVRREQAYEQQDRDRTAVHNWNQEVAAISKRGRTEGKSLVEIQSMLPAPPVLSSSGSQESGLSGMIHQALNTPRVQHFMDLIAPMADAWALENMIPQKPDYLSKQTVKTVYLSRYTYEELILGPQMLIAEFNLIFGVIAIVAAIPTGGGSLYLLAAADVALGAAMIWVNAEKLLDLKNGDDSTNPSLLGIDQSMLDKLGIALTVVNLGILLKHGLYAAANKLANGRNVAALDDTWTKFKLEHVKPKPKEAPEPPKTKTTTKEPSKGGPGVNQPIDEFDDAIIFNQAHYSRTKEKLITIIRSNRIEDIKIHAKQVTVYDDYCEIVTRDGSIFRFSKSEMPNASFSKLDGLISREDDVTKYGIKTYDTIRKTGLDDVEDVAKNTGLSVKEITALKTHLFLTKHNVPQPGGVLIKNQYFTPDEEIAYIWSLAQKQELTPSQKLWFKQLTDHELAESMYMQQGYAYRDITSWDGTQYSGKPPGAHDKAPKPPKKSPEGFPDYASKHNIYME